MKKLFLLAFIHLLLLPVVLPAQIELTSEDVPQIGDELVYITDTTVQDVTPGPPGINQNWNFSQLVAQDTFTYRVVSADQGPNAELFPEANIGVEVDSIFLYAILSDTALLNLGTALDLLENGMPFPVRFEPYWKLFEFPTTAGTDFQQTYRFSIEADGSFIGFDSVRFTRQTMERTTADASGTLTTPVDTYEALRLRTVMVNVDTIFVQQFGNWIPISVEQASSEQYNWVTGGGAGIVMTMEVDSVGHAENVDWLFSFEAGGEVTAPTALFSIEDQGDGTFVFTDQSANAPNSWQWDFGDGNTSNAQNPTHTYQSSGVYDVCLTVGNSAGTDTGCQMVNAVVTSVDMLRTYYDFKLFPNPTADQLNIRVNDLEAGSALVVFRNLIGQTLYRGQLQGRHTIDTSAWPEGAYLFSVYTDKGTLLGSGKVQINR